MGESGWENGSAKQRTPIPYAMVVPTAKSTQVIDLQRTRWPAAILLAP
jgi:hypothetical protein